MAGRKDSAGRMIMEGAGVMSLPGYIMMETKEALMEFKNLSFLTLVVGPLNVNCYIVWDKETLEACVIDPGGDAEAIEKEIREKSLDLKYVINTHGHFDHIGANGELISKFNSILAIHPLDNELLKNADYQSSLFGCPPHTLMESRPLIGVELKHAMELTVGRMILKILHTPGHTPGSVSVYIERPGLVFTGDTLFSGSVGRTDLEGGSQEDIIKSIKAILLPLGDDTIVLPGHGPKTTIGQEKRYNPFIVGDDT